MGRCSAAATRLKEQRRCRLSLVAEKNSGANATASEKVAPLCPALAEKNSGAAATASEKVAALVAALLSSTAVPSSGPTLFSLPNPY